MLSTAGFAASVTSSMLYSIIEPAGEQAPVYVKAGSVMPVGEVGGSTADPKTRNLIVRIFGDEYLPFTIDRDGRPELRRVWKNGKGIIEQNGLTMAYILKAWLNSTE